MEKREHKGSCRMSCERETAGNKIESDVQNEKLIFRPCQLYAASSAQNDYSSFVFAHTGIHSSGP